MSTGFFAYPSHPTHLGETIRSALKIVKQQYRKDGIEGWESSDIAGCFIIDDILDRISKCDFLAADVTKLNFNVTFEVGYAIGCQKRLLLTRNSAWKADDGLVKEVGIYDMIGYKDYADGQRLATLLAAVTDSKTLYPNDVQVNKKAPIYVVMPKDRTNLEIHLIARIKKAQLYEFIGCSIRLSKMEIIQLFVEGNIDPQQHERLFELLLWWGFLGIITDNREMKYIFSVNYHINHLKAIMKRNKSNTVFVINPAFWSGLEIQSIHSIDAH